MNMLKKIKNFCFDERTANWIGISCLIIVAIVTFTVGFDIVKPLFVYPEEEYMKLEKEAQRIITEQTLNVEFEHDINYSNTLENKSVDVKLYGDGASVVIDVDNFTEETESVNVYRSRYNGAMYYIINVAVIILAIVLLAGIMSMFIMVIFVIVGFVCKFIEWKIRTLKN